LKGNFFSHCSLYIDANRKLNLYRRLRPRRGTPRALGLRAVAGGDENLFFGCTAVGCTSILERYPNVPFGGFKSGGSAPTSPEVRSERIISPETRIKNLRLKYSPKRQSRFGAGSKGRYGPWWGFGGKAPERTRDFQPAIRIIVHCVKRLHHYSLREALSVMEQFASTPLSCM